MWPNIVRMVARKLAAAVLVMSNRRGAVRTERLIPLLKISSLTRRVGAMGALTE